MVFGWKTKGLYKVSAQTAGEEITRIRERHGTLEPHDVVVESRDESAVLHSCFEWDNDVAAERFRDQQARVLIGNLVTVNVCGQETSAPTRAFVHIMNDYMPVETVVAVKEYTDEMLSKALSELKSFETKYQTLTELRPVFKAIDEVQIKNAG